jgi:hypothetical protein
VAYPSTGQTLGDLLYAFWSEKGLQYRGTLEHGFYVANGAIGTTLGNLANDYFSRVYPLEFDAQNFDYSDPDEWLELQIFNRVDTVEQDIFIG